MDPILPRGATQHFTRANASPRRVRQDTGAGKRELPQGLEFVKIFPRPMGIFTGGELMTSVNTCEVVPIPQPMTPPGPTEFCGAV